MSWQLYPQDGEDDVLGYDGLVILDFASKSEYEVFANSEDYKEKTAFDGPRCECTYAAYPGQSH
jgi:hypothetical protein